MRKGDGKRMDAANKALREAGESEKFVVLFFIIIQGASSQNIHGICGMPSKMSETKYQNVYFI